MVNQKVGFFERNDKLRQMFNSKAKRGQETEVSVLFPLTKKTRGSCLQHFSRKLQNSDVSLCFNSFAAELPECPSSYSLHSMHDYILLSESEQQQLLLLLVEEDRTCNNTLGSSGATTKCLILLATWTTLLHRDKSNLKCRSIDLFSLLHHIVSTLDLLLQLFMNCQKRLY